MQVTLSNCTVTLKDELTYGDSQDIEAEAQAALMVSVDTLEKIRNNSEGEGTVRMNGKAILAAKYKAAEVLVQKIVLSDNTEVPYSKEWLRNLNVSDGNLLETHINLVRQGKAPTVGK